MPRKLPSSEDLDTIDQMVCRAYEEFLNEELPDRLVRVLDQLRAREQDEDGATRGGRS